MSLPPIITRAIDKLLEQRREYLVEFAPRLKLEVDSPIEWAMLLALKEADDWFRAGPVLLLSEGREIPEKLNTTTGIWIKPQAQIDQFRVDFLIAMSCWGVVSRLVVECDGAEHHDRTRLQVRKDKARDRELLGRGIPVVRFTGSEIFADASRCAEQAWDLVKATHCNIHGEVLKNAAA